MIKKEIRNCLEQIRKDYPRAEKYIRMLETKLQLLRFDEEFEAK